MTTIAEVAVGEKIQHALEVSYARGYTHGNREAFEQQNEIRALKERVEADNRRIEVLLAQVQRLEQKDARNKASRS